MDIERDDFASSGGDFYARGHVRTIAQKVGVDPAPLLAEFDAARPEAAPPQGHRRLRVRDGRPRRAPRPQLERRDGRRAGAGAGLRRRPGRDPGRADRHRRPVRRQGDRETATSQPEPVADAQRDPDRSAAARWRRRRATRSPSWCGPGTPAGCRRPPPAARSSSRACWRTRPGPSPTGQRIKLVIGNAGAVTLTVNGTPIGAPGPRRSGGPGAVHARGPRRRLSRAAPPSATEAGAHVLARLGSPHASAAGASRWSPSAALATRSTPRSWPAGWPPTAGTWSPTPADADVALVNTCGFVEAAKKDSIDTVLAAADLKGPAAAPRRSWRSAASPSGTASSSPSRCPRRTPSSASTTTRTSRRGCSRSWPARRTSRTCPGTGARCCRSRRSTGSRARGAGRPTCAGAAPASTPRPVRVAW